jgi:hypothetical protein
LGVKKRFRTKRVSNNQKSKKCVKVDSNHQNEENNKELLSEILIVVV